MHAAPPATMPAIVHPWTPDQRDGTFRNPVICADYSDPDVVRDGEDYYLVSSSFNCTPGLPILHSRDLVNWTIVNHALKNLPDPRYAQPQGGQGVWAAQPEIREVTDFDDDVEGAGVPDVVQYPVITGDYAAEQATWTRRPIEVGRPLTKPTPLFTKLDPKLGETGPSWAPIA